MKKLTLALLLFTLASSAYSAEVTKYVSDELVITLRAGAGEQYKILRTLPSGTRLAVLETSDDKVYSRVRTARGNEGWVRNQYLVNTPVARLLLSDAQKRLATLEQQYNTLKQEHAALLDSSKSTRQQRDQLDSQHQALEQELTHLRKVAARPLELEGENSRLRDETIELKNRLRLAEEKSQTLEDSSERQWFAVGAAVLFFGIIMGLILPKLRSRKRGVWSSEL